MNQLYDHGHDRSASLSVPTLCLLILVAVAPARLSTAQVNTERLRSSADGTTASVDATVSLRKGNSDLLDVASGLRVDHKHQKTYAFFVGRISYGTNDNTTYRNTSFGHVRVNRSLTKSVTGESFGQLERDGFTLLQLRALLGLGIRIAFVDSDQLKLYQGSAVMYENERLDDSKVTDHPARISTARWSNYVSLVARPSETVTFSITAYVQPRLDRFRDVRIVNDSSIEISLSDHLAYTTTFTLRHDADPPDGIEPTDILIRNGLKVNF